RLVGRIVVRRLHDRDDPLREGRDPGDFLSARPLGGVDGPERPQELRTPREGLPLLVLEEGGRLGVPAVELGPPGEGGLVDLGPDVETLLLIELGQGEPLLEDALGGLELRFTCLASAASTRTPRPPASPGAE
ncbi:MAG: hypothetical protein WKF75_04410, partial [Singulisphaera sp.]